MTSTSDHLARHDFWAEAISATECAFARECGFAEGRIVLNGPAKAWPKAGASARYAFADSISELETRLASSTRSAGDTIGVRIRPFDIRSRLGIPITDEGVASRLIELLSAASEPNLAFHFHMASSNIGLANWQRQLSYFFAAAMEISETVSKPVTAIDLCGGWHPDDFDWFIEEKLPSLHELIRTNFPTVERLIIEPGRVLMQTCGFLVARILAVNSYEKRREIVVDASIAELQDIRSHFHPIFMYSEAEYKQMNYGDDQVFWKIMHGA